MSREQLLELAAGMRQAADWIEANADLPVKVNIVQSEIMLDAHGREEISAAARAMGSFDKMVDHPLADWYYIVGKNFGGGASLAVRCDRGKVCKKVKRLKEVEEWDCADSILAPELPAEAAAE